MYHLPEGNYSEDFIRVLALAVHMKILEPEQLTFWIEDGKTFTQIRSILEQRIKQNFNAG